MTPQRSISLALRQAYHRLWPDIAQSHMPAPGELAAIALAQATYAAAYLDHLTWLQCRSTARERPVHLTFYPIAKNLRHVATELRDAVVAGERIKIVAGNPREERLLRVTRRGPWAPWLWSRIPRAQLGNLAAQTDDATLSWSTYFLNLDEASPSAREPLPVGPDWPSAAGSGRQRRILDLAVCTWYAFRLNETTEADVRKFGAHIAWPDEPVIAMHVRRGDAASDDARKATRPSWELAEYLNHADRMCERYGARTIYISTESEAEIERARKLRPQYRFIALEYDRSFFPTISAGRKDIEDAAFADPSIVAPIVESALADLAHIARCQAFIGAFNSEFSILGWLLAVGRNGHTIPYVDLVPKRQLAHYQGRLDFRLAWLVRQFYKDF